MKEDSFLPMVFLGAPSFEHILFRLEKTQPILVDVFSFFVLETSKKFRIFNCNFFVIPRGHTSGVFFRMSFLISTGGGNPMNRE